MHAVLEELKLFDFVEARGLLQERFVHMRHVDEYAGDIALLSGAEIALVPLVIEADGRSVLPLREPLKVSRWDAGVGLYKSNCLPTYCREPTWTDTTLFTGDLNKLRIVHPLDTFEDAELYWNGFDDLIEKLESEYRSSDSMAHLVESGLVRLQGAVWKAKLATILQPDNSLDALKSYVGRFGLSGA